MSVESFVLSPDELLVSEPNKQNTSPKLCVSGPEYVVVADLLTAELDIIKFDQVNGGGWQGSAPPFQSIGTRHHLYIVAKADGAYWSFIRSILMCQFWLVCSIRYKGCPIVPLIEGGGRQETAEIVTLTIKVSFAFRVLRHAYPAFALGICLVGVHVRICG